MLLVSVVTLVAVIQLLTFLSEKKRRSMFQNGAFLMHFPPSSEMGARCVTLTSVSLRVLLGLAWGYAFAVMTHLFPSRVLQRAAFQERTESRLADLSFDIELGLEFFSFSLWTRCCSLLGN